MLRMRHSCLRRLAGGSWASQMRFWRFLANGRVTIDKLIAGWSEETRQAVAGVHVLAIQDTSEIRFATTQENRRGLGPVKKGSCFGVLLHAMIAVDARSGGLCGLVGGHVWTRSNKAKPDHHGRRIEDKESHRWLVTATQAEDVLEEACMVTVVDDREGDFYAHWARTPNGKVHLLVRAMQDHSLAGGDTLHERANATAFCASNVIELRSRDGRPARKAHVRLRFGEVALARPKKCIEPDLPKSVTLRFVEVVEPEPPKGAEPVRWMLLTTHSVTTAAEALQILDWYRMRWIIEQLFRTMKTMGLRVEDSQLQSADRLIKIVAVAAKAAAIVMQLVQSRDGHDARPATNTFSGNEIEALRTLNDRMQGKTQLQKNPHPSGSLAWAAWVIAKLGGWSGYASHRPPGPVTFHNGLVYFRAYAAGWKDANV